MLAVIAFAALASAMPITTEASTPSQSTFDDSTAVAKRIAAATVDMVKRSVCAANDDATASSNCPHVNSILRACFALFCLFAFLIAIHVWQAAKYNKIQAVFGTYIADDMDDINSKTPYILLNEPESP
ncbi:hypothetical protein PWT90_05035 [Aphanocladium album]|nr:hypothetical protein PWT90_05035 [Aphanocladium album]